MDARSLERLVKKSWFKSFGERVDWGWGLIFLRSNKDDRQSQKHLTWVTLKNYWTIVQWSEALLSDQSNFRSLFLNQGPRVWRESKEAHKPRCLKSRVNFLQSVMVWDDTSSAGVADGWSTVFYQLQSQCSCFQGGFRELQVSICWRALWRCWFSFPSRTQHLHTVPKLVPNGLLTMLLLWKTGQPTHLTWTLTENQRGICQDQDEKHLIQYRQAIKVAWASETTQQTHKRIASMGTWCSNSCKGATIKNEHTFQKLDISVFEILFWSCLTFLLNWHNCIYDVHKSWAIFKVNIIFQFNFYIY